VPHGLRDGLVSPTSSARSSASTRLWRGKMGGAIRNPNPNPSPNPNPNPNRNPNPKPNPNPNPNPIPNPNPN
jgi:hypothetical protein